MNSTSTTGIVLTRTDFGEGDRIIKFLTPDHGKITVIAKGVRLKKSKLAGSVELFSVSDISYIVGRSEIYTLISARLVKHFGDIVKDIDRTNSAYEFLSLINKNTEDATESDYFNLLATGLEALNDLDLDQQITKLWFYMQLLKIAGHAPNLHTDNQGSKLLPSKKYNFQIDNMHFVPEPSSSGIFTANHIKFLRLGFSAASPKVLSRVENHVKLTAETQNIIQTMLKNYTRP